MHPVAVSKKINHGPLPGDVEQEILARLPVKTLLRFKCVCKSWLSIISSLPFQEHHYRCSQNNPLLLTLRSEADKMRKDITIHISTHNSNEGTLVNTLPPQIYKCNCPTSGFIPIQSCRGLVCLASKFYYNSMLIINPSSKEIIRPPSNNRNALCVGFGYAAATDEFKTVKVFPGLNDDSSDCFVYTLGAGEWREARNHAPYRVRRCSSGAAAFLHGCIHLLPHGVTLGHGHYIAAFDIERETFKRIPLPEHNGGKRETEEPRSVNLTEIRGSLCLVLDFGGQQLEIWLLRNYDNDDADWVKKYKISVSSLLDKGLAVFCNYPSPLGVSGYGSLLLNLFAYAGGIGFLWLCYDPELKTVTRKMDKGFSAVLFSESLFSLGKR